jgi:hypothetical protein
MAKNKKTGWLAAALAIASMSGVLPGPAGGQALAGRRSAVTLAGKNVIEGSAPSVIDVRIPRDVEIDLKIRGYSERGPSSTVSLAGGGRAVGIALTEHPPVGLVNNKKFLLAGRFSTCAEPGCFSPGDVVNFQWPRATAEERWDTLLAGDYRLFLITDGAPVKVTLRLRGLRGSKSIRPTAPTPLDLQTPPISLTHTNGPSYYAAGSTFQTGTRGFAVTLLSVRGPKDPVWAPYGACAYWGGPAKPPDRVAYGPHCTAGLNYWVSAWENSRRFDLTFLQGYDGSLQTHYDGTRGQGAWAIARGPLDRVASQIFTLPVD